MKFTNLEKLLPFGYLLLIVLGIVKESVFYYQIGINILSYSTLMDILIGPISDLTSHPVIFLGFMAYILFFFVIYAYATKHPESKLAEKFLQTKKLERELTEEELKVRAGDKFIGFVAIGMMSFFLGIGLGSGNKVSKKIDNNSLKYTTTITFNTGESKQAYLIGSNSANFFYVEKGSKNVKISPTLSVKSIELTKDNKLK